MSDVIDFRSGETCDENARPDLPERMLATCPNCGCMSFKVVRQPRHADAHMECANCEDLINIDVTWKPED